MDMYERLFKMAGLFMSLEMALGLAVLAIVVLLALLLRRGRSIAAAEEISDIDLRLTDLARLQEETAGRMQKTMRGRPCALVTYLLGLSVRRPTVAHCREAGESLAALHLAGAGFAMQRDNDL
eukprot:gene66192-90597_t